MKKELTESKWNPTSLWTPGMICLIALIIIKLLCLSTIFGGTGSLMYSGHLGVCVLTSLTLVAALLCFKLKDTQFVPKPGKKQYCGYICVQSKKFLDKQL